MAAPKGNKFALGKIGGRPPHYETIEELENKIDEYFSWCSKKRLSPQITGLTLFLGFQSRSSLDDYANRSDEFSYIIKKAKLFVESSYEEMLQEGKMSSIFALKNMGWKDNLTNELIGKDGAPISVTYDLTKLSDEELRHIAELQRKAGASP